MPISEMHNIDNIEFMKRFPDNYFDLADADPPYGLNQDLSKAKSRGKLCKTKITSDFSWDKALPSDEYFKELFRVSRNQIIWGGNYFSQIVGEPFKAPRRGDYEAFIKQNPTGWIIWDKANGDVDFSDCELAWTSFQVPTEIFCFMWAGMRQGKSMKEGRIMQGNKKLNEKRVHPTQKPIPLYQYQMERFASPGEKVISPNAGSQSDRIACYKMGIHYYGCEIDPKHYSDGCERYKNNIRQPLFDAIAPAPP